MRQSVAHRGVIGWMTMVGTSKGGVKVVDGDVRYGGGLMIEGGWGKSRNEGDDGYGGADQGEEGCERGRNFYWWVVCEDLCKGGK
eukprot:199899-Hanusia_phi.AAC.4